MFNGIIKNTGIINKIIKKNNNCFLEIKSKMKFSTKEVGSSISCSGVCLTLDKIKGNLVNFYVSKETLNKSTFKLLRKGNVINLEKSLKFGNRISGHFVQGHVDTTAIIKSINFIGHSWFINFKISSKFRKYLIQKGSISINGVSLTISKILSYGFEIVVIPKTLKLTNLVKLREKDLVNVEFDILGKYIKRLLK
jgi:riboflavin synthase